MSVARSVATHLHRLGETLAKGPFTKSNSYGADVAQKASARQAGVGLGCGDHRVVSLTTMRYAEAVKYCQLNYKLRHVFVQVLESLHSFIQSEAAARRL